MNVLITGATGFVGRALAERLRMAGHVPTGLSRSADRARRQVAALSVVWSWDPAKGPPPAQALAEADAVVNLAGEPVFGLWTAAKRNRIHDSRIRTTRHLVDGMRRAPSRDRVLVSASAIGYYGDRGDTVLCEDAAPGEGFLPQVCRDWEAEAERATAPHTRVVRLRIGLVLDRSGGMLETMTRVFSLGLGARFASGRQFWAWIQLQDLLSLIVHTLEHDVAGALNATAPEPVRQAVFTETLAGILGRPAVLVAPAFALKTLGELSTELLASRRVVPEATRASGFAFTEPSLDGALRRALGRR